MTPQELIKSFEKCRLKSYKDGGGVWTCGWGSTGPDINAHTVWTQDYADARFEDYFEAMTAKLRKELLYPNLFSDNQWAALCSLVYNIGDEAFKRSTILNKLNRFSPLIPGHFDDLAKEITKWHYDNGRSVDGLVARRQKEKEIFLA